jgi:Fe-S cluster assembly protein SufD
LVDRSTHLWRYTNPEAFTSPAAAPAAPLRVEASDEARRLGLRVEPLGRCPEALDVLGKAVPAGHGPFEARNLAEWNTGVAVLVPRNVVLKDPVRLVVDAASTIFLPRLVVLAGDGADVTLLEEHVGGGEGAVVIGVTELFAGPGARLTHAISHAWLPGTRAHLTSRLVLDRDANGVTALASTGGQLVKTDVGVVLAGPGARSEIVSLVAADDARHVDVHTVHDHRAGHTWSNVAAKVALAGSSRAVYTGLIRIERDARCAEAFQENRNLMLSARARVDTIPELEILNDEVSCTHGATVAPIDAAMLFYLESRGVDPREAQGLIVDGFFADGLARLPEPARDRLAEVLRARLAELQVEAA